MISRDLHNEQRPNWLRGLLQAELARSSTEGKEGKVKVRLQSITYCLNLKHSAFCDIVTKLVID